MCWYRLIQQKVENLRGRRYNMSEFLELAKECDTEKLLRILDNHFDALKVLCPEEYRELIRQIRANI